MATVRTSQPVQVASVPSPPPQVSRRYLTSPCLYCPSRRRDACCQTTTPIYEIPGQTYHPECGVQHRSAKGARCLTQRPPILVSTVENQQVGGTLAHVACPQGEMRRGLKDPCAPVSRSVEKCRLVPVRAGQRPSEEDATTLRVPPGTSRCRVRAELRSPVGARRQLVTSWCVRERAQNRCCGRFVEVGARPGESTGYPTQ